MVNADLIETMEACPDTTITLMTKRKFVVAESLDDVIDRIVAYRRSVYGDRTSTDPARARSSMGLSPDHLEPAA